MAAKLFIAGAGLLSMTRRTLSPASNSGLSASEVPKGTNLHSGGGILPDWGKAAHLALELLLPLMALLPLLAGIQRLQLWQKTTGWIFRLFGARSKST